MKKHFLFLLMFVTCMVANAQERTVTGVVTSADGEPLIGATVMLNGSNQGGVADLDGRFSMDPQMEEYLDKVFKSTRIFSVGDSLGYVTNIEGDGKYLLGIYNHGLSAKPFKIETNLGTIRKIEELHPVRDLTQQAGYFPEGFESLNPGVSDSSTLAAADVRLFRVTVDENKGEIVYLPKVIADKAVTDRFLAVNSLIGLADRLQCMPTLFDHFSGVSIHWSELQAVDSLAFSEDAWWYNLKKLQFLITFDHSFEDAYRRDKTLLSEIQNTVSASEHVAYLLVPATIETSVRTAVGNAFAGYPQAKLIDSRQAQKDLTILDVPYKTWDELYPSVKKLNQKVSPAKPENATYYFSYHDNHKSLVDELTLDWEIRPMW